MRSRLLETCRLRTWPLVLGAALAVSARAAEPAGGGGLFTGAQKPAWLTELSLGVAESYDDNLMRVSGDNAPKESSWATTVSPKLGVNLAPLLGQQSVFQVLALGYAPEFVLYYDEPGRPFDPFADSQESYNAHRFAQTIQGRAGAFSFNLDNALNYVDGSTESPVYAGNDRYRSSYASSAAKERRNQVQDRAKVVLQYDLDSFFFRPTASLLDYDMMTVFRSTSGYQNYPDRADVNGGADVGYRFTTNMAVTVGYRYGHQSQQTLPLTIDPHQLSSASDYQRVLLGLEGKPLKWFTVAVQGGPDFRDYAATAAVNDHHPIKWYGEALLGAQLSPKDNLTFKYRQWQFVSYSGRVPVFDSNYELTYRRKFTPNLVLDLSGRLGEVDFTSGDDPYNHANLRDDRQFSVSAGLSYALNSYLSLNAAYCLELGRNALDNPPGGVGFREFNHNLVSFGATLRF